MDFFVRESRAVVDGPMAIVRYVFYLLYIFSIALIIFMSLLLFCYSPGLDYTGINYYNFSHLFIIRFGTCGGLVNESEAGKIILASHGSGYITRNPDYFCENYGNSTPKNAEEAYHIYSPVPADSEFSNLMFEKLSRQLGSEKVVQGMNCTAESFYSSQGRIDPNFDDNNHEIIDKLLQRYPDAKSLEMETFILLHLAKCSKISIKATAAAIVVANRPTGQVIGGTDLDHMELFGGKAVLEAVSAVSL